MTTIQIGPIKYKLFISDERITQIRAKDFTEVEGYVSHQAQQITVSSTLTPERKREIILHEVIHAILCTYDIDNTKTDERFVRRFTTALSDTLNRNPELIGLIYDKSV